MKLKDFNKFINESDQKQIFKNWSDRIINSEKTEPDNLKANTIRRMRMIGYKVVTDIEDNTGVIDGQKVNLDDYEITNSNGIDFIRKNKENGGEIL